VACAVACPTQRWTTTTPQDDPTAGHAAGYRVAAVQLPLQPASHLDHRNLDKWVELSFNPFGWRTGEFFNWGLQGFNGGRLQELREQIDAGRPVPLGLFKAGNGGAGPHHQVVAVGYDLGRYTGDLGNFKEDLKIFVYDPNHHGEILTLVPSVADHSYHYAEPQYATESWMTYFVNCKYTVSTPLSLVDNSSPDNNLVSQLVLDIGTGGDDLRGGNDNVNATVTFRNQPPPVVHNLNNGARWIGHYSQSAPITLEHPVPLDEITSVVLSTTFGGGISGETGTSTHSASTPQARSSTKPQATRWCGSPATTRPTSPTSTNSHESLARCGPPGLRWPTPAASVSDWAGTPLHLARSASQSGPAPFPSCSQPSKPSVSTTATSKFRSRWGLVGALAADDEPACFALPTDLQGCSSYRCGRMQ
jgi:hypothetical protein